MGESYSGLRRARVEDEMLRLEEAYDALGHESQPEEPAGASSSPPGEMRRLAAPRLRPADGDEFRTGDLP